MPRVEDCILAAADETVDIRAVADEILQRRQWVVERTVAAMPKAALGTEYM